MIKLTPFSLALSLVLMAAPASFAASWHVSTSGSNTNDGSQASPFRTVAHAISQSASGDTILLARGDLFRESSLDLGGGRTLASYGEPGQPMPVLTGSVVVTGWTETGANVWEADFSASVSSGEPSVFLNGERLTLARTPNDGWFRVDAGTGTNQIIDAKLGTLAGAADGRWTGGQIRWRKWSWWYETRPITSDLAAGILNLGGSSPLPNLVGIDGGYYIDNHPDALDAPGEWYWDRSAGTLRIVPPAGVDMTTATVEVAVRSRGISISGGSILRDLHVRHYTDVGIGISGASTAEDCLVEHVWNQGISGSWGAAGSTVRGCTIRDILNVGIGWNENPGGAGGSVIERNHLVRCGTVPGMGGNGPWHAAGVIISNAPFGAKGVQFRLNRVEGTGYAGIILGRDGQTVERNVFRDTMNTLNDGAAVYTNCSYSYIRENIILDVEGDLESSHPWTPLGAGIWLEFLSNFHHSEVVGNTVYGSGGDGLFLPNNFNCLIEDNTFLSNLRAGMTLGGHEDGRSDDRPSQNHVIRNNLLGIGAIPWAPSGYRNLASWGDRDDVCLTYKVYNDRDLDFGTMSGTTFLTQDGQDLVTTTNNTEYSISEWQAAEPAWADISPVNVIGDAYLFINDTEALVDFPLPLDTSWTTLDGLPVGPSIAIEPFASAVLLSEDGVIADLPGYLLYSELVLPISWTEWLEKHALTGADAGADADPDLDQLANAVEFALATNPKVAETTPPWHLSKEGSTVALEASIRESHEGVDVSFETSLDLDSWTLVSSEDLGEGERPGTRLLRCTLDPETAPFARLRVTETP